MQEYLEKKHSCFVEGFLDYVGSIKNMFKLKLLDFKNSSNVQIATAFLPLCPLKTQEEITIK